MLGRNNGCTPPALGRATLPTPSWRRENLHVRSPVRFRRLKRSHHRRLDLYAAGGADDLVTGEIRHVENIDRLLTIGGDLGRDDIEIESEQSLGQIEKEPDPV